MYYLQLTSILSFYFHRKQLTWCVFPEVHDLSLTPDTSHAILINQCALNLLPSAQTQNNLVVSIQGIIIRLAVFVVRRHQRDASIFFHEYCILHIHINLQSISCIDLTGLLSIVYITLFCQKLLLLREGLDL